MLNVLQQRVLLGESRLYLRLCVLISLAAFTVLYHSSLGFPAKVLFSFVLVLQLARIYKNPTPYPEFSGLSCHTDGWIIYKKNQEQIFYEKGSILIDTTLFFLLELAGRR